MITREQGISENASVDSKELLDLLRNAISQFLRQANARGFRKPLDIAVRDVDGDVLREFRIERNGKLVQGSTGDVSKLFVLPLTLFCLDATGRIAKLTIDATRVISPTEFPN